MSDIRSKLNMLYSLEQLAEGESVVHRRHPMAKLLVTLVYLLCVASCPRDALYLLLPFLFYPVLVMSAAQIPWNMILKRTAAALPFCLFAGISNLILDREVVDYLGQIPVTAGFVSFAALLLRTCLCVSAVLILAAVTPFTKITLQLRRLHVPAFMVMLLEMIYRYISVLAQEAATMVTAYRLRSNGSKWPTVRDFGPFVGQLLLRSTDRAERIWQAMQCRCFSLHSLPAEQESWNRGDILFVIGGCGSSIAFRIWNFSAWLGGLFF